MFSGKSNFKKKSVAGVFPVVQRIVKFRLPSLTADCVSVSVHNQFFKISGAFVSDNLPFADNVRMVCPDDVNSAFKKGVVIIPALFSNAGNVLRFVGVNGKHENVARIFLS